MVIIGLGNPGGAFEPTYHNVGKLALTAIAEELRKKGVLSTFQKYKRLFSYAAAGEIALVAPLVFMNESGAAVKAALKKFKEGRGGLIVLHDESDLAVGDFKFSAGRGAAGHKGIRSIVDALGSNDFLRVRIGIRNPREHVRKKAAEFVLQKITAKDKATFEETFKKIAERLLPPTG